MQLNKRERYFRYGERILFAGFFLAAWLLCGRISYSDGDDAYFSAMAHSMPFWEYLKMRYIGWEGRMTSEAMTYLAFYFGKAFWQTANAFALTMLPAGLIHIVKKIAGNSEPKERFFTALLLYLLILSLGIAVVGYGAFWVTGSTFYLWSIVAGIWAAMPFVDLAYRREEMTWKSFLYALPCAFLAAMGQEQIAAVVIAFGILAVVFGIAEERRCRPNRTGRKAECGSDREPGRKGDCRTGNRGFGTRLPFMHILEVLLMIGALAALFLSPGTDARTQSEIDTWMPEYGTMSTGNHIFITVQWMLSSFANEGKLLFCLIWIFLLLLLWRRRTRSSWILAGVSGILALVSLLPFMGITYFSEMGMGVSDYSQCVTKVATPASLTGQNWAAMIFWTGAVLFTLAAFFALQESLCERLHMILLMLAACASECILYFSPTMYASGPRVYFMSQILLWLLAGMLGEKLISRGKPQILLLAGLGGILNVVCSLDLVMGYL